MPRNLVRMLLVVFTMLGVTGMALATDLPLNETLAMDVTEDTDTTASNDTTEPEETATDTTTSDGTAEAEETVTDTTVDATDTANETAAQSYSVPTSKPEDPVGAHFLCYQPSLPSISLMTGGSLPVEVCVGTDYNGCDVMIKAMYYACAGGFYPL